MNTTSLQVVRATIRSSVVFSLFIAVTAYAQTAVVFNIHNAWEDTTSLPATYTGGAQALGTASSLVESGLYRWSQGYPPYPNLTSPGHWVFAGWSHDLPASPVNVPYMQFSFTASQPVSLGSLNYTYFSGNWSDLWIGPEVLQIWVSKDGFATSSLLVQHSALITHPFTGAELTYHDDLSSIGNLLTGETLAVRFVASYEGQSRIVEAPAGFLFAVSGTPIQLSLDVTAIPEPAEIALLCGLAGLSVAIWRRRSRQQDARS